MTTLAPRRRKAWVTAHVAVSVAWLGGAYCMLVLGMVGLFADDPTLRMHAYEVMHLFDRVVHLPLGLLALGTGVVLSLRTRWGLLRHRWVVTKLVLTVAVMILAPVLSIPRVDEAVDLLRAGVDPGVLSIEIPAVTVLVLTTLTVVTVISVFKPWGRTRFRRPRADPGRPAGPPARSPDARRARGPRAT